MLPASTLYAENNKATTTAVILFAQAGHHEVMTLHNLLSLPTELRLGIYRELVTSFLVSRQVADIRGVFLSCQQIHQELEDEYIAKARHLLDIVHEWRTKWEELGVLDLQLANSKRFEEAIKIATISISSKLFPEYPSPRKHGPPIRLVEPDPSMLAFLYRLFCQSHETLIFGIDDFYDRGVLNRHFILNMILRCLLFDRNKLPLFGQVNRLVFYPGLFLPSQSRADRGLYHVLYQLTKIFSKNSSLKARRTWAAREAVSETHVRWSYGIDFKDGLPEAIGTALVNNVQAGRKNLVAT